MTCLAGRLCNNEEGSQPGNAWGAACHGLLAKHCDYFIDSQNTKIQYHRHQRLLPECKHGDWITDWRAMGMYKLIRAVLFSDVVIALAAVCLVSVLLAFGAFLLTWLVYNKRYGISLLDFMQLAA